VQPFVTVCEIEESSPDLNELSNYLENSAGSVQDGFTSESLKLDAQTETEGIFPSATGAFDFPGSYPDEVELPRPSSSVTPLYKIGEFYWRLFY